MRRLLQGSWELGSLALQGPETPCRGTLPHRTVLEHGHERESLNQGPALGSPYRPLRHQTSSRDSRTEGALRSRNPVKGGRVGGGTHR